MPGGGLNIAHEAVTRHAAGPLRDHVAFRFLTEDAARRDVTYGELDRLSNRFANVLRTLGVAQGDRMLLLTGRVPELYLAMLGGLKNGTVVSPLFSAFGPEPIATRIGLGRGAVLVTTAEAYRRKIATVRDRLPTLRHVLVIGAADEIAALPGPLDLARLRAAASDRAEIVGEVVKAFVSLKQGRTPDDTLRREISALARKRLGAAVAPKEIAFGRGGSMHLYDAATRFFGGTAIVGSGLPLAAGLGLAERMQGGSGVTACFFGDGAMAEGAFHEAANLAALWHAPVLFCCENNLYAMGTSLAHEHARTDLATRAAAYGMATAVVDGMDVLAVHEAVSAAVAAIRAGAGPHFLEMRTYRFRAHSMFDPELYRGKDEVAAWKEHDPIPTLRARLLADGVTEADLEALDVAARAEVAASVEFAEASPWEPVEDLLTDVTTGERR